MYAEMRVGIRRTRSCALLPCCCNWEQIRLCTRRAVPDAEYVPELADRLEGVVEGGEADGLAEAELLIRYSRADGVEHPDELQMLFIVRLACCALGVARTRTGTERTGAEVDTVEGKKWREPGATAAGKQLRAGCILTLPKYSVLVPT